MGSTKLWQRFREYVFGTASQHYGHDQIIRKWTQYPAWLPLNIQIQHGFYADQIPELHEKKKRIRVMLTWSSRIADKWIQGSNRPAVVLGAPFTLYRQMMGIQQSEDARGTVVFPDHSTPNTFHEHNVEEYAASLRALPDHLKPITICLHHRDMDYYGPLFSEQGFTVVTAGHGRQPNFGFVRRFYEILSAHRYCSSNFIGSFTFYAVEMGIPFFIWGPESKIIDMRLGNVEMPRQNYSLQLLEEFSGHGHEISDRQRRLVLSETGVEDRENPDTVRRLFVKDLVLHEIWLYPLRALWFFPSLLWRRVLAYQDQRHQGSNGG